MKIERKEKGIDGKKDKVKTGRKKRKGKERKKGYEKGFLMNRWKNRKM